MNHSSKSYSDYRLADVWQQCAQRREEQTATIEVSAGFFLRINVTPFLGGASNGYLVLLQDLSHLYRLEDGTPRLCQQHLARAAHPSGFDQGSRGYPA